MVSVRPDRILVHVSLIVADFLVIGHPRSSRGADNQEVKGIGGKKPFFAAGETV
jgi:hypothetical protein